MLTQCWARSRIDIQTNFFTNRNRIEKSNAFDVAAITAIAGISDHHMKKGRFFAPPRASRIVTIGIKPLHKFALNTARETGRTEERAFYAKRLKSEARENN